MALAAPLAVNVQGSGYGTTEGGGERWPHAPLAVPRLRATCDLSEYWHEISRLENEADQVYRRLIAELLTNEKDAITVLKFKGVIDALEATTDAFETAALTVESIAIKES